MLAVELTSGIGGMFSPGFSETFHVTLRFKQINLCLVYHIATEGCRL